jgi:ParB family chromosome partitioning protein
MSRKSGLGKGLDALIPTSEGTTLGMDVFQVSVDLIKPNPRQPRSTILPESLKELADSIIEHGVIQPLVVSRDEIKQEYILVAGDRRLQAARLAGLTTVPVLVRQTTDQQRLEMALVENLQRIDLNPLESAQGYQMLSEDFGLSHEEIAKRVGKSRTTVTNTLRLLKLSPPVRKALTEGRISEGHARAILPLASVKSQSAALRAVLQSELNVRQTEALVRRLSGERRKEAKPRKRSAEEIALEDQLRESLGTRVTLRRGSKGGSLIIHFYSDEELNTLVDKLLGEVTET